MDQKNCHFNCGVIVQKTELEQTNQRLSFRMPARDYEDGAGIVIEGKVIPGRLINYSVTGCCIRMESGVAVVKGDSVRVATSQGQYHGMVRNIHEADGQKQLGIQFTSAIDQIDQLSDSLHFWSSDSKHRIGGSFSFGLVLFVLATWGISAYLVYVFYS